MPGVLERTLRDLEPSLGELQGEPTPVDGGITNRNFRVRFGTEDYMVRLHGKDTGLLGIDRDAERIAADAAAALGIAPAVVASFEEGLVTRYVTCSVAGGSQLRGRAEEVGRALRLFHDSGTRLPVRFWVPDLLDAYSEVARARGGALPDGYEQARALARRIERTVGLERPLPCHNDLLPGNLISDTREGCLLIVDWEYAGMGHPLFDLGNVSVNNDFDEAADERLLSAYDGSPPTDARMAAVRLMRVLSDAREAAWGVVQAYVSELDFDFDGYAREHFERMSSAADGGALEEWLAAA